MIETRQLTKRYGELIAVNHIDLNLAEGDVFGFIGPNGSGKTTTMRMIATLLQPDYGEAYVCGKSIYTHPQEIRRLIGFMPDFFGVYEDMTVVEYLEFFAAAYRVVPDKRRKVVEEKLELVDMAFKRDAMVNQLSRGQTQRIGLARVMLHDPQVLLLDEPTNDLDVDTLRALEEGLQDFGGCAVVVSHDRWFLDRIATHILAFEGNGQAYWFEGNYEMYEANRKQRLGEDADRPRARHKPLNR